MDFFADGFCELLQSLQLVRRCLPDLDCFEPQEERGEMLPYFVVELARNPTSFVLLRRHESPLHFLASVLRVSPLENLSPEHIIKVAQFRGAPFYSRFEFLVRQPQAVLRPLTVVDVED